MLITSSRRAALFVLASLVVFALTACGDDDDGGGGAATTSAAPTTQSGGDGNGGDGNGDGGAPAGGSGTASASVAGGTYEMQIEEPCLISEIGIGVVASSDDGTLVLAGIPGAVNVTLELPSGDLWLAAAADVAIDETTMSYSGPSLGPGGGDDTLSVQVSCDELEEVPGG